MRCVSGGGTGPAYQSDNLLIDSRSAENPENQSSELIS